jgi:hypothetical protein
MEISILKLSPLAIFMSLAIEHHPLKKLSAAVAQTDGYLSLALNDHDSPNDTQIPSCAYISAATFPETPALCNSLMQ